MNLKNYTSTTPSEKSIFCIEQKLVSMGATNITKDYKDGILGGIRFLILINGNTVAFSLPARIEAVFETMWKEIKRPREETKNNISQQAERTAWKLIADWVDVQASMIYLQQAEVMQVFLPYAIMPNNKTVFESIKEGGMKMLTQ